MHKFILAIVLATLPLVASHHKTVEHDQLEVGKTYFSRADHLKIYNKGPHGWVHTDVYGYHILKILKRERDGSTLWYRVRRIEPETLDRTQHIEGLIQASDLKQGAIYARHE
jgi:hypothetical protein